MPPCSNFYCFANGLVFSPRWLHEPDLCRGSLGQVVGWRKMLYLLMPQAAHHFGKEQLCRRVAGGSVARDQIDLITRQQILRE